MKTILIFVTSLDGKVTRWEETNAQSWSSHQDHDYYKNVWKESPLIVEGSKTYEADPRKAAPGHLLVVMTRNPEKYKNSEEKGQLEFTNESPAELHKRFEKNGCKQMLVAGGPHIATAFLKENLIDELWLTIEPKIFGTGSNFAIREKLDITLQLIYSQRVNDQGTLITKYEVVKK